MSGSPTSRSIKAMADRGYLVAIVERYNPFSKRKNDLFGFVDLLCVHQETGDVAAVQTTSYSNLSSRINKK